MKQGNELNSVADKNVWFISSAGRGIEVEIAQAPRAGAHAGVAIGIERLPRVDGEFREQSDHAAPIGLRIAMVSIIVVIACCGCGQAHPTGSQGHVLPRPNMHVVKRGMTKPDVQRLLGKPDDLYTVPRVPGVDWIFVYPDGRAVVHFNGHARVTSVEDCPRHTCTVLVPSRH